jgi:hypothetical protein
VPAIKKFNENEVFSEILEQVSKGMSLVKALETLEPSPSLSWARAQIRNDPELRSAWAQAMEDRADYLADELIELADSPMPAGLDGHEMSAWVNQLKLRVHAREWSAGKLRPKLYGSSLNVAMTNEGISIRRVMLDAEERVRNDRLRTIDME